MTNTRKALEQELKWLDDEIKMSIHMGHMEQVDYLIGELVRFEEELEECGEHRESKEMKQARIKREKTTIMEKVEERKKRAIYNYRFSDFYMALEKERKKKGNMENETPRFMGSRIFREDVKR